MYNRYVYGRYVYYHVYDMVGIYTNSKDSIRIRVKKIRMRLKGRKMRKSAPGTTLRNLMLNILT